MNIYKKILDSLSSKKFNGELLKDVCMTKYTTYKIGGKASVFAKVYDCQSLQDLLRVCKKQNICWHIIGKGSNLLVSDKGYEGVIVYLDGDFKNYTYDNNIYDVGAAVLLAQIVNDSKKKMLSGFEFGVGTPGTIGGAVKMNAGTANQWISNVVKSVVVLNENLKIDERMAENITWGYRHSSILDNEIILRVTFEVKKVDVQKKDIFLQKFNEMLDKRHAIQPLNYPSCGSVFKNPKDSSAGKLIEDAGLKGLSHGGGEISDKHANFILNKNKAKAQDIVWLIHKAQKEVFDKFSIKLLPEVKFLGFDENVSIF